MRTTSQSFMQAYLFHNSARITQANLITARSLAVVLSEYNVSSISEEGDWTVRVVWQEDSSSAVLEN